MKPGIWAQGIRWGAAVTGSALSLLNAAEAGADHENGKGDEVTNACEFLNDVLADGQMPSTEIESQAKASGFTVATLRRAKKRIGVRSVKSAMSGCWVLALPKVLIKHEGAHTKEVSAFGANEHLRSENDETELEL